MSNRKENKLRMVRDFLFLATCLVMPHVTFVLPKSQLSQELKSVRHHSQCLKLPRSKSPSLRSNSDSSNEEEGNSKVISPSGRPTRYTAIYSFVSPG